MTIDRKYLNDNCAVLVAEIRAEGHAAGLAEGRAAATESAVAAAREQAAAAERSRIQDVEAQSLPGHETLIAALKFDGKTTGPQAAVQILQAEKAKGGRRLADLHNDAPTPVPASASAGGDAPKVPAANANAPVEERCKAKWGSDPAVRSEFLTLEAYTAFERANEAGKVRILNKRAAA